MIFRFKKKIKLKTKYKNESECLNNCRDIKHMTYRTSSFSEKISGEVDVDANTFELSGIGKNANVVVFSGEVIEDKGIIYMKGEITPRLITAFILYGIRFYAIYILINGLIDIYKNRIIIGDLYNSVFLLTVAFLVFYYMPQLTFYGCYKSFINKLNKKVIS